MSGDNIIQTKTRDFALHIISLYKILIEEKKEYVLSKQLLRSGTSIGANVRESKNAQSRLDFINKLNIALKEADETDYWLDLLYTSKFINEEIFNNIQNELTEIIKILTSIIKTTKLTTDK
ncbi:MAG: four helix bundle protein [Bacteroidales bacterium]|nr:four helix bundle protein [Bacteroidales bacterium]